MNGFLETKDESERFILESDGLVIKNVTRDDAGDYICKAYQVSSKVSDIKEQIIALDVHCKDTFKSNQFSLLISNFKLKCSQTGNNLYRKISSSWKTKSFNRNHSDLCKYRI